MKKTFKKITAAFMAVASLTVGVTGIGASAANDGISPYYSGPTGYVSFGNGATAGIYADSTTVDLSTSRNVTTYELYAGIDELSNGTVGASSKTAFNKTSVSFHTTGSNISGLRSYHYYDTTAENPSDRVSVYCRR